MTLPGRGRVARHKRFATGSSIFGGKGCARENRQGFPAPMKSFPTSTIKMTTPFGVVIFMAYNVGINTMTPLREK
jgi:hypothetical protein